MTKIIPARQQILAPEHILRAYLKLLKTVAVHVRRFSAGGMRMPDQQLLDLMNVIHDIPDLLTDYDHHFTDADIRAHLTKYDEEWSGCDQFSLVGTLENIGTI